MLLCTVELNGIIALFMRDMTADTCQLNNANNNRMLKLGFAKWQEITVR